jgi:hypothetical protein
MSHAALCIEKTTSDTHMARRVLAELLRLLAQMAQR